MAKTILLADDSVTIQKVVELTFMEQEDFEVHAVSTGDEALAQLPGLQPDLVIADVNMPGADGYEVCRRSKASYPNIPVLLLVGTFEPFDEAQARAAGADGFLKKPFDSQELLRQVESLTQRGDDLSTIQASDSMLAQAAMPPAAEPAPAPAFETPTFAAPVPEPMAPTPTPEPVASETAPLGLGTTPMGSSEAAAPAFETPVFEAPAMEPPAIEPPTIEPPTIDPPTIEPPAFETPAIEASAFETPAIEPEPVAAPEPFTAPEPVAVPEPVAAPEPVAEPAPVAAEPAATSEAAAPAASNGHGALSDEDVERIAKKVADILGEKILKEVAWEVVPDLAEVIIKNRLQELEGQIDV